MYVILLLYYQHYTFLLVVSLISKNNLNRFNKRTVKDTIIIIFFPKKFKNEKNLLISNWSTTSIDTQYILLFHQEHIKRNVTILLYKDANS